MKRKQEVEKSGGAPPIDVGAWIGRGQAFGIMAGKCAAAQAECLRTMKRDRMHERLGITWEQFCEKHIGVSRSYVHRLIQRLEEFGPDYFRIDEVVPLSPESYRLIAGSVREGAIEIEGEAVPITQDNAVRIHRAVEARRAEQDRKKGRQASPSIDDVRQRLDTCIRDLAAIAKGPEPRLRHEVSAVADQCVLELRRVARLA
jgi:hypothetical protein